MAMHLGSEVVYFWSHHIDGHCLNIGQTDRNSIVLRVNHHLIGCVADMGIGGVPKELHLRLQTEIHLGVKHGRAVGQLEWRAGSGQSDIVAVGVGSRNEEAELLASNEAIGVVALYLGQVVVAVRDEYLHITHNRADPYAMAPLLHHNGHVVLALQDRGIPAQFTRNRVDVKRMGGLRQGIACYFHAVLSLARDQFIT